VNFIIGNGKQAMSRLYNEKLSVIEKHFKFFERLRSCSEFNADAFPYHKMFAEVAIVGSKGGAHWHAASGRHV